MFGKFGITVIGMALLAVSGTALAFGKPVSKEKLQDRTAFALGLENDDFTLSDIKKEGFETRYVVKTKSGAEYRCYVGSSFLSGVSDAICSKKGEPAKNPLLEAAERRKKK
ncbi:hypothetical protein SAMN05216569_1630 [Pseudoxanthomonas sp. CF125]|nr:hypothetical protein SAMN05216569_1630 [Pseudoxanthomonas sp. CF125]